MDNNQSHIPCLPNPQDDPLFRVIRIQSNKPNIAYDFLGAPPTGWVGSAKSYTQTSPGAKVLQTQFPQNPESFWKREPNTQYHWIPARIRLDDTIEQIKRKIIFALAHVDPEIKTTLPLTSYIELWIATPPNSLWSPKINPTDTQQNLTPQPIQYLKLGERFNAFDVSLPSNTSKPQIDNKFLTSSGKARTDLVATDERDRLLHDFFEEIDKTIKNPIIFCHLITDAVQMKLPDNNETRYGFFQKYWPYANLPPTEVLSNDEFQSIRTYISYDTQLFDEITSTPLPSDKLYKNNCLIEKLEILVNPQLTESRIDLFKLWYILHLDETTVFKRYREPDEAPVYKFYKPAIKERKIPSKMSFAWIGLATSTDARFREARIPDKTLTVKRFLYQGTDGPRYATIHIKSSAQFILDLSFQGKPAGGAVPEEVNRAIQEQFEWISNIHQSFDIREDRSPNVSRTQPIPIGHYKFDQRTGEFLWSKDIQLNGLQLLLASPSKQTWVKPDYDKTFKKFTEMFTMLMIPDLRQTAREIAKLQARKEGELVYRYTRISNYSLMQDRYVIIQETILEMPSADRATVVREIVRKLVENFNITEDSALQTFQEWDQIYGFTLSSEAARLLRQTGFVIRFSPVRIQLHGIRDGWLGHRALSIIFRIWNQFIQNYKISPEFKKVADAYRKGQKIEEHIQTQTSLGVGSLSRTNIFQTNTSNFSFGDEFSSEFLSQVIANSNAINREISGISTKQTPTLSTPFSANPDALGKDMGLDQYCAGEDADTEHQTCRDICMDDKYALRRLQLADKTLFAYTKSETGVKHSYSQACQKPSQPIVVDYDPENDPRIAPDTISYAVRYGSDPTRQYWYMCPEAWCPYEEIPIKYDLVRDKVQLRKVRDGEVCRTALCPSCQQNLKRETWLRLLPSEAEKHIYPGFNDKSIHPNDLCLPCCYSIDSRDKSKKHYTRMLKCLGQENANKPGADQGKDYLLGREKVPLPGDRFGILTPQLQSFFIEDCESGYLQPGRACIVRRGISSPEGQPLLDSVQYLDKAIKEKGPEWIHQAPQQKKQRKSKKQSQEGGANNENNNPPNFNVPNNLNQQTTTSTSQQPIQENLKVWLKELINRFPKEQFASLARGQLVRYFQPEPIPSEWKKLSPTKFYQKLQEAAYDNWVEFITNPNEKVPINIMWDFLQRPGILAPEGVNVFIIRGDQVLCPLGDEIDELFNPERSSIFLLTNRDESYFEPIVHLENRAALFYVNPLFPPKHPLVLRVLDKLHKSCATHQTVDWNRIRKDYAPNAPVSTPRKPKPTLRNLRAKINPNQLMSWKQWTDPLHQISGLISPEGYLLPAQSSRPLSNIQEAATEVPIHSYLDTLKAYQQYAKFFDEKGYEPARMSVSPKDANMVVGIQLANEYVIQVKPTEKKNIPFGKQLPETLSYLDPTVNRELIQQNMNADNRVRSIAEQDYVEETFQRLRFTIGRALSENHRLRAEVMEIAKDASEPTKSREKKIQNIIVSILKNLISTAPTRDNFTLSGYQTPNIREVCHLSIPKRTRDPKEAKEYCEETPHCRFQDGKCLLWIPNIEKSGSKVTTQQKLIKKLVKEIVLNPFKREEVVYDRIEDFIDKSKIEAENHEIFLTGEGATPYTKLVAEYRPAKKITSKFAVPTYQTAQPQLTPENRERYRFHLGSRMDSLAAFLPNIYPLPNHWEERFGKGYLLRQADKELDQFFLSLRGSAEDVYDYNQQENRTAESQAWTIWKPETTKQDKLKLPGSWQMSIADWKVWYREHLELVTANDINLFLDILEEQYPRNKSHPFAKEMRKQVEGIQKENHNKEQSVIALTIMKLVWKTLANATVARNLQLWEDVQKYLDRGDYPFSDFDFFLLNRYLGLHICILEQRRSTTNHPSGYTWFRAESLEAPVWVVYVERDSVLSVSPMEYQNHLFLPLNSFTQQVQKWIQESWKNLPISDIWYSMKRSNPWRLGRKYQWNPDDLKKWN